MARLGQFGNNAIRTLLVEGKGERQFFRLFKLFSNQDLVILFQKCNPEIRFFGF